MNWKKIGEWFIEMFALMQPGAAWGFYTMDIHSYQPIPLEDEDEVA